MSKQAKDFGLVDLEEKGNTFDVASKEVKPETEEEAIVLDIIGSDSVNLAASANELKYGKVKDKSRFIKAYQKVNNTFRINKKVPLDEKAIFYELLSTMIGAGIPVISGVKVYTEQTKHRYFQKITQALAYQLEKGQSFSEAMSEYRHIFSEAEVGIVESAEATGRLNEVLARLAFEAKQTLALRSKIKSAMIYPIIVIIFVIGAIYAMLRFVIPGVRTLFESASLELPFLTQMLITASDFVVNNTILLFVLLVGSAFLLTAFGRTKPGKRIYHSLALKLPVLKDFQSSIYQGLFARSISNLLNSGVGIVDACNITSRSMKNVIYKEKVVLIGQDVSQGISIAESMQDSPYFSNLTVSMFAVGEKTAQIDELAAKTADYFENKVSIMANNFAKIIQPFIIGVVGGIVAVVVLAIMLPMTELLGGIDAL